MPRRSKSKSQSGKERIHLPNTPSERETFRRVLDAIGLQRREPRLSLSAAARRSSTTVKTIRRYAADALEIRSGRFAVQPIDHIARELQFLGPEGLEIIKVRNSRDATRIAKYSNALRNYLMTGDDTQLREFRGKTLRAHRKIHEFVTDERIIQRLARAGEIRLLDIYGPGGVQ